MIEYTLIGILIFLLGIIYYTTFFISQDSLGNIFIKRLKIIAYVFIPIGIYLTYRVFYLQEKSMEREATYKIIDRSWLNINKSLIDYYKECPTFINSLYFNWQKDVLGQEDKFYTRDKWYAVNYLSISIFQAWEDFITSLYIDETGPIVWINNFIQWANSPILYKNWGILKSNFADTTIEFGDYIFSMVQSNTVNNTDELHKLAYTITHSDKFKKISHKRLNYSH